MPNADFLVLGVKAYDFQKEGQERLVGANVHYIDLLMSDYDQNTKGYVPMKTSCTPKAISQLTVLPGLYNLEFRQKPGANGKATLVLADAEFISKVNLLPVTGEKELKAV